MKDPKGLGKSLTVAGSRINVAAHGSTSPQKCKSPIEVRSDDFKSDESSDSVRIKLLNIVTKTAT